MSKNHVNVHPDHYKVKGREPNGKDVLQEVNRQQMNETEARLRQKETAGTVSRPPNAPDAEQQQSSVQQTGVRKEEEENK